ncbi:MAG: hypothetical protein PUP46_02470 [Endozoicomonas sp. (ex Botrylloides leachii)]|nr:hypothetical protein [Endozoicomonas sp. (ex Botrylloides leachii)]
MNERKTVNSRYLSNAKKELHCLTTNDPAKKGLFLMHKGYNIAPVSLFERLMFEQVSPSMTH